MGIFWGSFQKFWFLENFELWYGSIFLNETFSIDFEEQSTWIGWTLELYPSLLFGEPSRAEFFDWRAEPSRALGIQKASLNELFRVLKAQIWKKTAVTYLKTGLIYFWYAAYFTLIYSFATTWHFSNCFLNQAKLFIKVRHVLYT